MFLVKNVSSNLLLFLDFQATSTDILCPNQSLLVIIENTTVYSMARNSSSNNISFTVTGLDTGKWLTAIAIIVDTNANAVIEQNQINICKLNTAFTSFSEYVYLHVQSW